MQTFQKRGFPEKINYCTGLKKLPEYDLSNSEIIAYLAKGIHAIALAKGNGNQTQEMFFLSTFVNCCNGWPEFLRSQYAKGE